MPSANVHRHILVFREGKRGWIFSITFVVFRHKDKDYKDYYHLQIYIDILSFREEKMWCIFCIEYVIFGHNDKGYERDQ